MAYASWSVVFGEQPSAAKWNILGTNDASFNDGTGIADGAIKPEHLLNGSSSLNTWVWDSWTPTLSGQFTNGDWTKACKYIRVGNTVICKLNLVSADATPMAGGSGDATFTLPVTAVALSATANVESLGNVMMLDAGTEVYVGTVLKTSTTTASIRAIVVDAVYAKKGVVTATVPFTWTTSDEISGIFMYEAAP